MNEALRNRFVCGLRSKETQKKLLTEEHTFDAALKVGHGAIKDSLECLSCGKTGHPRSQCKYRNYTCHSCGKVGHISEACKGKPQKVHQLEGSEPPQTSPPDDSVDPFSLSLCNLSSGQQGIEIPVELNGTSLLMELDTGAGVSVISEENYKKNVSGTSLMPSNTRLRA